MSWNPTNYQFAWNVVYEYRFWLLEGTLLTLKIAALSMALAMVFALPLALLARRHQVQHWEHAVPELGHLDRHSGAG